MVAIVGSFAGLVCVITAFVWLIVLIVGNTKIKHSCRKVFLVSGSVFLICGIVTMFTHNKVTSSNVEHRSKRKKVTKLVKKHKKSNAQKVRIYPVTIQKISTTTDGYWIISGKTKAPDDSKIFVNSIADLNCAFKSKDSDSWAKVKNHSFKAVVSNDNLTNQEICPTGKKINTKIFSLQKYNEPATDADYNDYLKSMIKSAAIQNTSLVVDNQIHNFMYQVKLRDNVRSSEYDFENAAKKDLNDMNLNKYSISLNNNYYMITVKLAIPTREWIWGGIGEYTAYLAKNIKQVNLNSKIKYLKIKYYESDYAAKNKRATKVYLTEPAKKQNWKKVLDLNNDDLRDFMDKYNEEALVK